MIQFLLSKKKGVVIKPITKLFHTVQQVFPRFLCCLYCVEPCVNFIVFWERAGGAGWAKKTVASLGEF